MKKIVIDPKTYEYHKMTVAGVECSLPICKLNDDLYIAGFVIFGRAKLTVACAEELCKRLPEHDVMITAESKGIPLITEMARISGDDKHLVARKHPKLYMKDPEYVDVNSITTSGAQRLYLDKLDMEYMRGKRVVIVDDVISTGESLKALEKLVEHAGGNIVAKMAILAEGDAADRSDLIYLEELPLFVPEKH